MATKKPAKKKGKKLPPWLMKKGEEAEAAPAKGKAPAKKAAKKGKKVPAKKGK